MTCVINFGDGDAIEVALGLGEATELLTRALGPPATLIELTIATDSGREEAVIVNPLQVQTLREQTGHGR